jgi:hypothetical protein
MTYGTYGSGCWLAVTLLDHFAEDKSMIIEV